MVILSRGRAIGTIARAAAGGAMATGLCGRAAFAGPLTGTRDITQEQWFDAWCAPKPPEGALHLYRFADEIYSLTKPIAWTPGPKAREFKRVDVPAGFVTDFASVPRIFWSVLPRDGKYTYPAII